MNPAVNRRAPLQLKLFVCALLVCSGLKAQTDQWESTVAEASRAYTRGQFGEAESGKVARDLPDQIEFLGF